MKSRKQKCSKCGGLKIKLDGETSIKDCPQCNGEGVEYIITPEEWREYVELVKGEFLKVVHNEIRGKQMSGRNVL